MPRNRRPSVDMSLLKSARRGLRHFNKRMREIGDAEELQKWEEVKAELKEVELELREECASNREAELTTWLLFETAALSTKNEMLCDITDPWMAEWNERYSALILEALMMAFDIGRGFTEKEAYGFHQEWLDMDPENRIYGTYFYSREGKVVKIGMRKEHLMSIN